jgi:hypothetical protein
VVGQEPQERCNLLVELGILLLCDLFTVDGQARASKQGAGVWLEPRVDAAELFKACETKIIRKYTS